MSKHLNFKKMKPGGSALDGVDGEALGEVLTWNPKFFLRSKTLVGVLVTVLGLLVGWLGLPVEEQELAGVAGGILDLVGLALVVYGRVKAKQPLSLGRSKGATAGALLVIVLPVALGLHACATRNLTPLEQARLYAAEMSRTYMDLYVAYQALEPVLPEAGREALRERAAPAMDTAKRALAAFNRAVILWSRTGREPTNLDRLANDAWDLLGAAAKLLEAVTQNHMEDKT